MGIKEEYEARKVNALARQERPEKRLWWFRQPSPIDRFTGWLVTWTALLFFATIGSVLVLHHTDDKIGRQLTVVGRQLEVMENDKRPWLAADLAIPDKVLITEWGATRGISVALKFTLKNHGQTPAINVRSYQNIVIHPGNIRREELSVPQKEICDASAVESDKDPIGGIAVFPGETGTIETGVGISGGSIYKDGNSVLFSILGCIDYTYGDKRHGQTGFRFLLGQPLNGLVMGVPFIEGVPMQLEDPSKELIASGFPNEPPKYAPIKISELYFKPADSGNYAK